MVDQAVWDSRWTGQHGIARFASEVSRRLSARLIPLDSTRVRPASMADPGFIHRTMRDRQPRLFFSPGFNVGFPGSYDQVVTVHDLIHLKVAQERSVAKSLYYSALVGPVLRRSPHVLTVSEFSKREIVKQFGLDGDQVVVVGNGSSMEVLENPAGPNVADPFVLFVGNAKPHKNLELLVRASVHVDDAVKFVVVGVSTSETRRLCEIHKADLRRFRNLSALTDVKMQDLYTRADCVALPSTYEGFGLAAVEAMSRATPTVYCSEAVHEVAGSTGFLAPDPTDALHYAGALEHAISAKSDLFGCLVSRAATFSWDHVAARVASVLWAS